MGKKRVTPKDRELIGREFTSSLVRSDLPDIVWTVRGVYAPDSGTYKDQKLALNAPGASVLPRRMLPSAAAGAAAAPVRHGGRPAGPDLRVPEHTADADADDELTDGEDDDEYEEQPDEEEDAVDTGASAGAGQTVGDRDSDSDENSDSDDDVPTADLSIDDLIAGLKWSGKRDRRNLLDRAPDNLKTTNADGTARVEGPAHPLGQSARALDYFQQFFTPAIQALIVTQTNLYAAQMQAAHAEREAARPAGEEEISMRAWKVLTRERLMKFVGLLIMNGVLGYGDY